MSGTKIDGPPREKLYESADDDPAKISEEKAKAEWEAKKAEPRDICAADPDFLLCAPKDRTAGGPSYRELAKNLGTPAPRPGTEREAWQKEADTISERLRQNPVSYVGKKEDMARLGELQKKLATRPADDLIALPATNDAGRKTDAPDGWFHGAVGHDGASVYAGGTTYKTSDKGSKLEVGDVSAQLGASTEIQLTAVRATDADASGSVVVEGPSVKFSQGFGRNDDGSVGYHAGASANLASVQVTRSFDDGASGTVGIGEGVGVGGSVGTKTTPTGETAACVQVSALFFTAGVCLPVRM